jgi:hypothetical protein
MPPTNISAATATEITAFPFLETLDVLDAPNEHEVWFRYTNSLQDGMTWLGVEAESEGAGAVSGVYLTCPISR